MECEGLWCRLERKCLTLQSCKKTMKPNEKQTTVRIYRVRDGFFLDFS